MEIQKAITQWEKYRYQIGKLAYEVEQDNAGRDEYFDSAEIVAIQCLHAELTTAASVAENIIEMLKVTEEALKRYRKGKGEAE